MGLVIRHARVGGQVVAVRLDAGTIREIAPDSIDGDVRGVRGVRDDLDVLDALDVLDVEGAALVPGLHDHHVHLTALAAAAGSVRCGPPDVVDGVGLAAALAAADRELPAGEWIRGVGYHESVAGLPDRAGLDAMVAARPVRIQHRTGILWLLNSAGLLRIGAAAGAGPPGLERDGAGTPTGRLWREDAWLRSRIPSRPPDLAAVSRSAAARGVTGFTDATPHADPGELAAVAGGVLQRLCIMSAPEATPDLPAGFTSGPAKVILDDDRLPPLQELVDRLRGARLAGRAVAVHCVTHVQAALALAAIEEVGARPGDRLEHGALLSPAQVAQVRDLGLTVVTQPGFVAARGDQYLCDVPDADQPDLWRLASLIDAGIPVAAGTDAPYGPEDPWPAIEAATTRLTASGRALGPGEAVSPAAALRLFQGRAAAPAQPRTVAPGQPADLCVLGDRILATIIGGRVVYQA